MPTMKRAAFFMLTAATAATPAWAQTQASEAESAGEIVVTAQKSEQRAQDVPLAVTAVSGEALAEAGATRIQDIAAAVPALQVDSLYGVPGAYGLTLRGITTGTQASSTVATYIDDVPIGSSGAFAAGNSAGLDLFPYDLERVEVLEGPQGTLYGASSMGGLVKYVTRTPSLTENRYQAGAELVTVDHGQNLGWTVRGGANIVVVPDQLAISISGTHQDVPGYVDNAAIGKRDVNQGTQDAARGVIHWKPTDNFTLKASGLYNRSKFDGLALINVNAAGTPLFGKYTASKNRPEGFESETRLGSITADYDFGFATLTSITSLSDLRSRFRTDSSLTFRPIFGVDATFANDIKVKKFTEELRLASPQTDRLQWLVGSFFTRERTQFKQLGLAFLPNSDTQPAGLSPLLDGTIPSRYREWALFANTTYNITNAWDIGGGIRYSRNSQRVSQTANGLLVGAPLDLPARTSSDSSVTYTLSTSYHVTKDAMFYGRISSGYRPGGPNFIVPGIPQSYEPDTLTNYEIGLKSNLLDRKVMLNLSAYYIDWRDIQLQGATPTNLSYIANGGKAISKGVQGTLNVQPATGLTLGGSFAYTDTELKDDAPQVAGRVGDRLPLTPKWAGSLTADYDFDLGDDTRARLGLAWRYTGARDQYFPQSPRNRRLGNYSTLNLTAGVSTGPVDINLFVRNLTNKYDFTSWLTPNGATVLQPRTIGLSVDMDFR